MKAEVTTDAQWLLFLFLLLIVWCIHHPKRQDDSTPRIYGGAWATLDQLRTLFRAKGIPIGYIKQGWRKVRLYFDPQRKGVSPHIIAIGNSGSGKSSQTSLAAALFWALSLLFFDVGGEAVCVAGGYRKKLGRAVQWNAYHLWEKQTRGLPFVKINPIGPKSLNPNSPDYDAKLIKLGICSVDQHLNESGNAKFFYKGAAGLASAIIGTEVEYGNPKYRHLPHCYELACGDIFDRAQYLMRMYGKDPRIYRRWATCATKEAATNKAMWDIVYTLRQEWEWMNDETLAASLTEDEFSPVECKESVTSAFNVLPQNNLDVLAPPLRFLTAWNMGEMLCRVGRNIPTLIEVEEYYALQVNGRLTAIDEVLAVGRKFNVYLLLCIQNWPELLHVQGHDLAYHFLNSAGCVQWLAATDPLGSEVLSNWLGQKDIVVPSWSSGTSVSPGYTPGSRWLPPMATTNVTRSQGENLNIHPHPLMAGQDIRAMADDQQICIVQGVKAPVLAYREPYWKWLKGRAGKNPYYR